MLLATCGGHYIYSNDWLGKITLKISYIILTYIIKERMPISLRLVGWLPSSKNNNSRMFRLAVLPLLGTFC